MNTQRCSKETRTEFFTDRVEKGSDVHEQVTKDKLTIQEGERGSQPQHPPPMKKAPQGAPHTTICPHSEATKPLNREHVPEVGLESACSP